MCITRGGTVHIPLASFAMSRQGRTRQVRDLPRQVMPTLHTVKREEFIIIYDNVGFLRMPRHNHIHFDKNSSELMSHFECPRDAQSEHPSDALSESLRYSK